MSFLKLQFVGLHLFLFCPPIFASISSEGFLTNAPRGWRAIEEANRNVVVRGTTTIQTTRKNSNTATLSSSWKGEINSDFAVFDELRPNQNGGENERVSGVNDRYGFSISRKTGNAWVINYLQRAMPTNFY